MSIMQLFAIIAPCLCVMSCVIGFLAGHRMGAEDEKDFIKGVIASEERKWKRGHMGEKYFE